MTREQQLEKALRRAYHDVQDIRLRIRGLPITTGVCTNVMRRIERVLNNEPSPWKNNGGSKPRSAPGATSADPKP